TFTPTGGASRFGSIVFSDDAPGNPHSVSLSGTVPGPFLLATPSSLAFGIQSINTTSASKIIVVQNTGVANLLISSIVASADFTRASSCSGFSPGFSCTISVTYKPTSLGPKTGTLTITDNAAGSPHVIQLSGTGVDLAISPNPLAF